MSELKVVKLKLVTGNFKFFLRTLEKRIIEGWRLPDNFPSGNGLFVAHLVMPVSVNSDIPDLLVDNCKPNNDDGFKFQNKLDLEYLPANSPIQGVEIIAAVIDDSVNMVKNEVKESTVSEVKPSLGEGLSPKGFVMKPYSLEELTATSWMNIKKLGSDLGINDGNREVMTNLIVEESIKQWS